MLLGMSSGKLVALLLLLIGTQTTADDHGASFDASLSRTSGTPQSAEQPITRTADGHGASFQAAMLRTSGPPHSAGQPKQDVAVAAGAPRAAWSRYHRAVYGNKEIIFANGSRTSHLFPRNLVEESCEDCLLLTHSYDQQLAELSFNISCMNDESPCCKICTIGQVSLFTYEGPRNAYTCMQLLHSIRVLPRAYCIMETKVSQPEVVWFPHTDTGCYTLRFRPSIIPIPLYHGFFWLHSNANIVNVNHWNTTFYLNPNYQMETLEVTWHLPENSHNFANFGLQLWHHKTSKINCHGEKTLGQRIEVIPKNGSIVLKKPFYRFQNLSHGWYCARLTPLDDRCGDLGCQPLASTAMFYQSKQPRSVEVIYQSYTWQFYPVWLILPFIVAVSIVCTWLRRRHYKEINLYKGLTYTKVVSEASFNQEVLVLWTQAEPDGIMLGPMIKAFKILLQQKANCQVLDYLDLLSLPAKSQKQLLADPTQWIDSILQTKSIKIVLVASKGAHCYQEHSSNFTNNFIIRDHNENTTSVYTTNSLDRLLFPYILRKLKELPELSYDYNRVFHIRFPSICGDDCDLDGMVTWARYRLPEHFNDLSLRLQGLPDKVSNVMPEVILPSTTQLLHKTSETPACEEDFQNTTDGSSAGSAELLIAD